MYQLLLAATLTLLPAVASGQVTESPAVVFVCEHGAAKSVIATAYFNKLAADRGLPYRATFRGTAPQEALSTRAVEGLRADKIAVPDGRPTAIGDGDVAHATHIFAIGCTRCRLPRSPLERLRTGATCLMTRAIPRCAMRSSGT